MSELRLAKPVIKPSQSDWRPIASAPKNGTWLLLWNDNTMFVGFWQALRGSRSGWMLTEPAEALLDSRFQPTHWMPLPEPPHG